MLPRHHDPIVAIATASGRGAVGIVRLSGADLSAFVVGLFGAPLVPRQASYRAFRGAAGEPIDRGLAIHFPAPHSYTGEDVLELQAHGGPVVLQLLVARCLELGPALLPGLRPARPGEFTERAFLNDKIDLAQAEAVGDLIEAGTEAAARSASRALGGAFSAEIARLAEQLIELRTLVEATLDFPDEEIDFLEQADARGRLARLGAQLDAVLVRARQGVLLREGLTVVLAGLPNVGKSSLLNALAGAELAIVTPVAGTTRDRVAGTIQIEGVPVHVIDTAGLRESSDEVERIGIARSWDEIGRADAVLLLRDLTRADDPGYITAEAAIEARLRDQLGNDARLLRVDNKADAVDNAAGPGTVSGATAVLASKNDSSGTPDTRLAISARTGHGVDALRRRLLELAGWQAQPEGVFIARTRHLEALRRTRSHLDAAAAHLTREDAALDLLAEELRLAHAALEAITGRYSADDLLGDIFGRFCIGK